MALLLTLAALGATASITIDWDTVLSNKTSTPTLQVVVNPLLLADSNIRDNALVSLSLVAADYVRFVPWFPYPILSVPEIDAPVVGTCSTSWNFTYADQLVGDFFKATPNVSHIINFSTTPDWMWIAPNYTYPTDINTVDFSYNNGTVPRDSSLKEISDYFARIVSWYVNGGFTDECGIYHHSGHHYDIEYWEVLNESDSEHEIQPAFYNQLYDAIVTAIHAVSPKTKFVGLALSTRNLTYFESFLDASNHRANIPLDFFSYHFYASPDNTTTPIEAAMCYLQADEFFDEVAQIEAIRKRLAPSTKTTLDEIGTITPLGATTIYPDFVIPPEYWVWSGGIYAYIFAHVAAMGIDVIGESQLVGYPGQYPSVSMVNYTTGAPTARLRVLQLLQQSFASDDSVVQTNSTVPEHVFGQAFTSAAERKLLVINKQEDVLTLQVCGFDGGSADVVDVSTGEGLWRTEKVLGPTFNITGYATAILTAKLGTQQSC